MTSLTASALIVPEHGDSGVLRVEEREVPDPGPGQARVTVAASGVNFIDTYQRGGVYPVETPFVLGMEGAGTVESVGEGVTEVAPGDRVAWAMQLGSAASVATVPAASLVPVPDGVELDGSRVLPADIIVYATGYGSMNQWLVDLVSQEVADRVGKVWGYGSDTTRDPGPWEGELRNMWKPTQQPGLWFHGGNLHQSRHYSLYLALQLKARFENMDTPVYGLQEVHHLS